MLYYNSLLHVEYLLIGSTFLKDENHLFESIKLALHVANEINQTQNVSDLHKMAAELTTQQVRVGFVGMMKVGKSTTLNALLHKRYLPSAIQAETAIEVFITHNRNIPDGVLIGQRFTNSTEELAKGASNIHSKLWNINKQKRSKQNIYKKVWLNIGIPFLSALSKNFSLQISDTPGSDEAVMESLDLDKSIQHLAAFVIVLDYRKMKSDAEIALLKSLKQRHPTIFNSSERLLFILNHMNAFDEHRAVKLEDSIRPNDTPKFVAEYLKELLKVKISPDQVIPFSAIWALESRICLNNPDHVDDSIMEEAQLILRNQGQSDSADGSNNNIATCKSLEKYSKILEIENRLTQLFVDYGHKVIERDIAEKAIQILSTLLSAITEKLEGLGVPKANQSVLHQKQMFFAVNQIISDVPLRLKEPLTMLRSSTVANLSSIWNSKIPDIIDIYLEDIDAVTYQCPHNLHNAVRKVNNQFSINLIPIINQFFHDIVHYHNDIASIQVKEQVMRLQRELSLIFENQAMSYPLHNVTNFIPALPKNINCNVLPLNYIDIAAFFRNQTVNVTESPSFWCSVFSCEVHTKTIPIHAVKTLTLKNRMTKSLHGCFEMVKTQLTEYLDSFTSSANFELVSSVDSWWKGQKPKQDAKLQIVEDKLKKAIAQKAMLDAKRSSLEYAMQNVMHIFSNP